MTKELLSPALELSPDISRERRFHFLGVPLDSYSMAETLEIAGAAMKNRKRLQHVVVNVGKLVAMRHNPVLRRDVEESDLINIDGTGVLWGCRLLGHRVDERVAGIDLMANLMALCEQEGLKPYILGAKQEILQRAIDVLSERHPNLEIAGYRNGYFSEDDEPSIVEAINASGADCLFVAISSPHKENFLHRHRDDFTVPFLMGVGGAVDVLAGHVKRAPKWMQDYGLEWFYRMIQEPGRMWRRYFFTNTVYAGLLLRALWAKLIHGGDGRIQRLTR